MSKHRHKAREKNVQKFSRDGLIEQNLVTGESTHVSKREADQELCHSSSTEFEVKSSGDSSQHFGSHGTNVTPTSSEKRHTVLNVENETRITSTDSLPQQETQNYQSTTGYEPGTYAKDDDSHAQDQSAHSQSDTSYAQNYSTHSQSDISYSQHQQYQDPASTNHHNDSYSLGSNHSGNHVPVTSHHAQKVINRFSESITSAAPAYQGNQDYSDYRDHQDYQGHQNSQGHQSYQNHQGYPDHYDSPEIPYDTGHESEHIPYGNTDNSISYDHRDQPQKFRDSTRNTQYQSVAFDQQFTSSHQEEPVHESRMNQDQRENYSIRHEASADTKPHQRVSQPADMQKLDFHPEATPLQGVSSAEITPEHKINRSHSAYKATVPVTAVATAYTTESISSESASEVVPTVAKFNEGSSHETLYVTSHQTFHDSSHESFQNTAHESFQEVSHRTNHVDQSFNAQEEFSQNSNHVKYSAKASDVAAPMPGKQTDSSLQLSQNQESHFTTHAGTEALNSNTPAKRAKPNTRFTSQTEQPLSSSTKEDSSPVHVNQDMDKPSDRLPRHNPPPEVSQQLNSKSKQVLDQKLNPQSTNKLVPESDQKLTMDSGQKLTTRKNPHQVEAKSAPDKTISPKPSSKDNGVDLTHRSSNAQSKKAAKEQYASKMKKEQNLASSHTEDTIPILNHQKLERSSVEDTLLNDTEQVDFTDLRRNKQAARKKNALGKKDGKDATTSGDSQGSNNPYSRKVKQGASAKKGSDASSITDKKSGAKTSSINNKKKQVQEAHLPQKGKGRLTFTDEDLADQPTMAGSFKKGVTGKAKGAAALTASAASIAIRSKFRSEEDDNVALEGVDSTELLAEKGVRQVKNAGTTAKAKARRNAEKKSRLMESSSEGASPLKSGNPISKKKSETESNFLSRYFQKQRQKKEAQKAAHAAKQSGSKAAKETAGTAKSFGEKLFQSAKEFFTRNNRSIYSILAILLLLFLIINLLFSCAAPTVQILGTISTSSWPADDTEITKAEVYYTELEAKLQRKINRVETEHPGCDEYNYNVSELGHDPIALISYLCAKYGSFTFNGTVKNELNQIFAQQYQLNVNVQNETRTITKTVHQGESIGNVVTSGYCNCSICCGVWAGGATASGVYPQADHTIAVDAHNPIVPMGTQIIMNGKLYKVEDTGNFAQYGVAFDVYYDSHSAASAHGHKTWQAYYAGGDGPEVQVTTTENVKVCYVTLTSQALDSILENRLNSDQQEVYDIYYEAAGNRQFLGTPVDYDWHYNVSRYYGYYCDGTTVTNHDGLDLTFPAGINVLSPIDGTVSQTGQTSSQGKFMVISNDKGYEIKYTHLQSISKSSGTAVAMGDVVAKVGSTGNVSTPTLHIEFRHQGEAYDPYFYMQTGTEILVSNGAIGPGGGGALPGIVLPPAGKQADLLTEAFKHLGTPYVWGGYAPGGFDCSGYVSYCLTHSGARNTGHLTANGLLGICTPISKSNLKPGDLVFFQGTYNTSGASHVGIYVGSGQYGTGTFIHCGDPCKFGNLSDSYWIQHWYTGGRWY